MSSLMQFALAPELAGIVRPGVLWLEGATVVEREPRMDAPLAAVEASMREGDLRVRLDADIDAVRTMYKRVGIDPTRRRPSSEALLRRVSRGDPFPRVNSMVDICNWCSLEFQLPYGLYDASLIEGDVTLRVGLPGESYAGIRKDDVNVAGRIAMVDARGPFGNPTSDSARTMITTATRNALLIVFAPHSTTPARLATVLDVTARRMQEYTGARELRRSVST
jgi:DNA/RNA-binding domain of Phe-tRNA-synthetase-like protein